MSGPKAPGARRRGGAAREAGADQGSTIGGRSRNVHVDGRPAGGHRDRRLTHHVPAVGLRSRRRRRSPEHPVAADGVLQVGRRQQLRDADVHPGDEAGAADLRCPVLHPGDHPGPRRGRCSVAQVVFQIQEDLRTPGVADGLCIGHHQLPAGRSLRGIGPERLIEALEQHDAHPEPGGRPVLGVPPRTQRIDHVEGEAGRTQAVQLLALSAPMLSNPDSPGVSETVLAVGFAAAAAAETCAVAAGSSD